MTRHRLLPAAPLAVAVAAVCACSTQSPPATNPTVTLTPSPTATAPPLAPTTPVLTPGRPAHTSPSPALPRGVPDPRAIDHTDATAVAKAALITMWVVDSATDEGQRDAYLRALPYLTDEYTAQVRADPATPSLPGDWRKHRAYARVTVQRLPAEEGAPADTTTAVYRQWQITARPTGRDGWRGDPVPATAYTALQRPAAGQPWRIAQITTA
jgi:hypothetical protein